MQHQRNISISTPILLLELLGTLMEDECSCTQQRMTVGAKGGILPRGLVCPLVWAGREEDLVSICRIASNLADP